MKLIRRNEITFKRRLFLFLLLAPGVSGLIYWGWISFQTIKIPKPFDARAQVGLPTTWVHLPDKKKLLVEVASSSEQKEIGLMYRDSVPPWTGMLFVYHSQGYPQIWMKNTSVSLDILWLDSSKRITTVFHSAPIPDSGMEDEYLPVYTGYGKYVLELAAGEAHRLMLHKGMVLSFDISSANIRINDINSK